MFRRLPDGQVTCRLKFLLINRIEDDLLPLAFRCDACLGKFHLPACIFRSTGAAGDAKKEHFPGGEILQNPFNQFSQSLLTAFPALDSFILLRKKAQ
mgnify:CR=1 FL=1